MKIKIQSNHLVSTKWNTPRTWHYLQQHPHQHLHPSRSLENASTPTLPICFRILQTSAVGQNLGELGARIKLSPRDEFPPYHIYSKCSLAQGIEDHSCRERIDFAPRWTTSEVCAPPPRPLASLIHKTRLDASSDCHSRKIESLSLSWLIQGRRAPSFEVETERTLICLLWLILLGWFIIWFVKLTLNRRSLV